MLGKLGSLVLIFLLGLALAVPSALSETHGNEVNTFESLSVVIIEGEQTLSGHHAVVLRRGMDSYGNNDSYVSGMEVTAFEATYEDFVKEYGNEYTLNGISGQFTDLTATFKDATGPVNSTSAIVYEYNGRIEFTGVDADLDSYRFRVVNEGGDLNSTMQITINIPSGYEITDTQGIHGPDIGSKQTSVSGQTITDSNVAVDFAPADEFDWLYLPLLISGLISAIVVAVLAISYYRGGDEETFQQESPEPEADE